MMRTPIRLLVKRAAMIQRTGPALFAARFSSSAPMPPYDGHLAPEQMYTLTHMVDKIDTLESHMADLKEASEIHQAHDGELTPDQAEALDRMFEKIANVEAQVAHVKKMLHATYAVDAPDGDSDGHLKEELLEVEHIIEDAALHEDKAKIEKKHKLQDDVKKYHAKDPEHDW